MEINNDADITPDQIAVAMVTAQVERIQLMKKIAALMDENRSLIARIKELEVKQ